MMVRLVIVQHSPQSIGGGNIETIGRFAFEHTALTSVELPDGVTTIGNQAFNYCQQLTDIVLPTSISTIGDYPFNQCDHVENIELAFDGGISSLKSLFGGHWWDNSQHYYYSSEDSLRVVTINGASIGYQTLHNYFTLDKIVVGKTVNNIVNGAFSGIGNASEIEVESGNVKYKSDNNCLIEIATNKVIAGAGSFIVIPDYVTEIAEWAFARSSRNYSANYGTEYNNLYEITIPASVTSIGDYAFAGCSKLVHIRNLSSVTLDISLGINISNSHQYTEFLSDNSAFQNEIVVGEKYVTYQMNNKKYLLGFSRYGFTDANDIPNDIYGIFSYAFYGDCFVTEINIQNISEILSDAFGDTKSLKTIRMSTLLTKIGGSFLINTYEQIKIYYGGTLQQFRAITKEQYWNPHRTLVCTDQTVNTDDV